MRKEATLSGVLVSGGTGGHINAALSVGDYFEDNSRWKIVHITGRRALDYRLFKEKNAIHLNATSLRGKKFLFFFKSIFINFFTFLKLLLFFLKDKPRFVLGTGGYVCGPVLLAAYLQGIPIFILEQNSIMGFTNKLLSIIAKKIFCHFKNTRKINNDLLEKIVVSGNPVRKEFFSPLKDLPPSKEVNILVFGGSLGADDLNQFSEKLAQLSIEIPLHIRQQIGMNKNPYTPAKTSEQTKYTRLEYFEQIIKEYSWCDLIICRAGASTLSELRIIGKSTILIPFPFATDNHQLYNAQLFQEEVDFPVAIEHISDLETDNLKKMRAHIDRVWQLKQQTSTLETSPGSDSKKIKNNASATQIIFEEIMKDVS